MRITIILGLALMACGGCQTSSAQPPAAEPSGELAALVREFVDTQDADRADELLSAILHDPAATVASIESLLQVPRVYQVQPVGILRDGTIVVRDRRYPVAYYVPPSYRPEKSYGLVVCLHGAGFTGEAYLERWQARLGEDYILACPTFIQGAWFTRRAEDLVMGVIASVQQRYHIDPNRIFLTGMSNGGIGAWLIGMHHADRFAGLAPMASGLDDVLMPLLTNLGATPVYIIHGAKDRVMPVELSRTIATELARLHYPFVYREHDREHPVAGGHYFPREELPDLVAWFGRQQRAALPTSLTVVRDATHLVPFGWVRVDATDPIIAFSENLIDKRDDAHRQQRYAKIAARVSGPNRIEAATEHVRRYTVFLNDRLIDPSKPVVILTNGEVSFEGMVTPSLETLLRQARLRRDPGRLFSVQLSLTVPPQPAQ